jgi:hypothetical protein
MVRQWPTSGLARPMDLQGCSEPRRKPALHQFVVCPNRTSIVSVFIRADSVRVRDYEAISRCPRAMQWDAVRRLCVARNFIYAFTAASADARRRITKERRAFARRTAREWIRQPASPDLMSKAFQGLVPHQTTWSGLNRPLLFLVFGGSRCSGDHALLAIRNKNRSFLAWLANAIARGLKNGIHFHLPKYQLESRAHFRG